MIAVVSFPGSNCDEDARYALEQLGAEARLVWHRETSLAGAEAVVLPGGFSYGDYLRSGAMAAHSPVMAAVRSFAARGGPVLGICNGFQVLTESGLLPGALARNRRPTFVCRDAHVRVERNDLPFTVGYGAKQVLRLPVAHAEGRYLLASPELARLEARGGVVLRYCAADGSARPDANPNGSVNDIAAVANERGNVMGMMPHPERAVDPLLGSTDGRPLLASLLASLAAPTPSASA